MLGGSGEIRTRDQGIKKSRGPSKPYVNQWSKGPKNDCAIECAIAFGNAQANAGINACLTLGSPDLRTCHKS